ncbi:MAG: hypothetical protein BGO70_13910 [Bacteroidetes bacterium 43-93]|nr:ATP-dependent zinc metalloprotease FtsH [Bacteroidota bacterium]OJW99527.1 MAG: hypothetical protein BGO70_13910 [Bacteroidetes bacterium 43-93]
MNDAKKDNRKAGRSRVTRWVIWIVALLLINIVFTYFLARNEGGYREISWQRFKDNMLRPRDVDRIEVLNKEKVLVYIKFDSLKKKEYSDLGSLTKKATGEPQYYFTIGSVDAFEKNMADVFTGDNEKYEPPITYISKSNSWQTVSSWLLPLGLLLLFWFWVSGRGSTLGGGAAAIDFSKSRAEEYGEHKTSPFTFKDVAGYEEAKTEVMEIVSFLKQPGNFTKLGAKIPKGVLLVGPPGTGKTLLAKAVAGEAAVPFFSLSGSEFIELFVGVGASRVRDLFDRAKAKAPSIIFIDEIDTIGRVRGKAVSIQVNDERESTLNQLLAEMDGFDPNTGVIVMAATNRADILDAALLRAGRFDRHIYLELPNKEERNAIFKVHLKPLVLAKDVDSMFLAAQTPGFSGADIANVCNEAALMAARQKKEAVEKKDFFDAIDRVVAGLEKKTKIITPAEKKRIAFHEGGHAVVSWKLKHVDPLVKVSIIPRGKSLGGAWYLPEERQIITRDQFLDQLCAALAGRAGEEVVFNEISSGALDDLEKATKQAYSMVMKLGLSDKLGNISYYDSTGTYESSFQKPYSEATAQLIDAEAQKLLQDAYTRAKAILIENRDQLNAIADKLLSKEIIYKEDLEQILGIREGTEQPQQVAGKTEA